MRLLCAMSLIGLCLTNAAAMAWDGDWTQARSGRTGLFDDPNSTQGKAGTDPPQKYYTANPRDYIDVDPEELGDYFNRYKKEYSPYALARITQDIHYNNLSIPKGYYLIKPGDMNDGSPKISLKSINPPVEFHGGGVPEASPEPTLPPLEGEIPAVDNEAVYSHSGGKKQPKSAKPNAAPQGAPVLKPDEPAYQVFVIKRSGKVIGVVPINRMEVYHPRRKEHVPRQALAWVEMENRHPVLKFYYRKRIYSTDFQ